MKKDSTDKSTSGTVNYDYDPNYEFPNIPGTYQPGTIPYQPQTRKIKKITKTIEKYDKNGNYKGKRVETIEEEEYDKQIWGSGTITIMGSADTIVGETNISPVEFNDGTGIITSKDYPSTFTNSISCAIN